MEKINFSLSYYLPNKRWFHYYDIVKLDDNEFIIKLVVKKNFNFNDFQEILFRINCDVETTLNWKTLDYKNLIELKFRVWRIEPEDNWF